MTTESRYILGGGGAGRERLRVLSRVSARATTALLDATGVERGMACLDAGCGGGDVTLELAERVGPSGRVVGIDMDERKLELARQEARERGIRHVEYRRGDLLAEELPAEYDVVHARYLLTHVPDPLATSRRLASALRPGGALAVLDIDFGAAGTHPVQPAYERFVALYCASASGRGADPRIGPRLPWLLERAGLEIDVLQVHQPIGRRREGLEADVKLIPSLTMGLIADSLVADGLATAAETERLVAALHTIAVDGTTVVMLPRTVGVCGRREG